MSLIALVELACCISPSATSFFGDGVTTAVHSTQYTKDSYEVNMSGVLHVAYLYFHNIP